VLAMSTLNLTSVARTKTSLAALDAALPRANVTHHHVQLDWSRRREFLDSLSAHIERVGPPSLVVAWLHDDLLGPEVARVINSQSTQCDFFQVRGSSGAESPASTQNFAEHFKDLPSISFYQVILGFIKTSSGSRWLRNSEISQGVLRAVESRAALSIVGVVEPWDDRP
jgi:hypothetical protein